jgi:hypothetical protein
MGLQTPLAEPMTQPRLVHAKIREVLRRYIENPSLSDLAIDRFCRTSPNPGWEYLDCVESIRLPCPVLAECLE